MSNRLTVNPEIPLKFGPFLEPARYKGAHGGRGSAKSHFFATLAAIRNASEPGLRGVCIRETQRSLEESAKRLIGDKIMELGLGDVCDVQHNVIKTPGDGIIIFEGMQNHTAQSIKSLEGYDWAWVEEGQTLSSVSLELLRPTIRKPGSELWFTWNPEGPENAVDQLLRGSNPPDGAVVIQANWRDNPWFPKELEAERQHDLKHNPDRYDHIWEGAYAPAAPGAFFAKEMARLEREGRITKVEYDPELDVDTYWDIGYTDDTAIWFAQWAWGEIRVIDHYATHGENTQHYAKVCQDKGYRYGRMVLPHDAFQKTLAGGGRSVARRLSQEGLPGKIVKAPAHRLQDGIQSSRDVLPICFFDADKCAKGLASLRAYRRQYDAVKKVFGKTPIHDGASHDADAFRQMAQSYKHRDKPQEPEVEEMRGIEQATFNEVMKLFDDMPISGDGRI